MKNKKSQDPTEAALSAIEDALNIGKDVPEVAPPAVAERNAEPERREMPRRPERQQEPAEEVFAQRSRGTRERLPRPAANDDRRSVGQILQALHRKPSGAAVITALLGSIIWIIGGAAIASSLFRNETGAVMRLSEIAVQPTFMPALAALFLPPLLFFMTAMLIRRSQEMRHISRAMTEVTLRLAEPEGVSTDAIVSVGQAIRREVAALGDGIERAIARAAELESMVRSEVATLERAYDENEGRVRTLVGELHNERDAIVDHAGNLREAIATAHEAFAFDVQNIADRVASALENATSQITDNIVLRAEDARVQITDAGNGIVESIIARAEDARTQIAQSGNAIVESIIQRSDDARGQLNESGNAIVEILAQRAEDARGQISLSGNAIVESIIQRAEDARSQIDLSGNAIVENIMLRAEDARSQLSLSGNTIVQSLSERSAEATQRLTEVGVQIAKAIADRNEKVSEALQQSTNDMHTRLAERAANVAQMIAESSQTFENTIGLQLQNLAEMVSTKGNEIAVRISADTNALGTTMTESVQTFDSTVKVYGNSFVNEMKSAINEVAEASRESLAALDDRIAGKIEEVSGGIDERIAKMETSLDERAQSINETLINRALDFSKTITQGAVSATEAVDRSVTGMGEYFSAKSSEMAATLSERAAKIDETLGNRATQMAETLDSRVNKFEELIVNRLEAVTSSIEQKGVASADLLVERVGAVNEVIRGTASEVERNLTMLADGIAKNFVERVNNITGAHETLRSEVRDIINELGQTHGLLQAVIDTASSTLGPIEGKIADKVTSFHQTLDNAITATRSTAERMDQQIRQLNDSSNGVLRDVSSLAIRFEEQVRLVSATTEALNETHRRIDDGLANRRDSIDKISTLLSERTTELEERLTRFNGMLEGTFEHAQSKAQEVARAIAESTAGATQSISRQYELIRATSTEERERSTTALKDTYDEAMQQVNAMFSETNARFLEASRDLREISEDIQRTLDTTREEIRRTVFELPTETKESANAMRRVVADQIKALSELNEIVARHGRQGENAAPAAYEYREEQMATVGGRASPRNALPRPEYDEVDDLPPAPPPARLREQAPEPNRPERKASDRIARFDEALNKKTRPQEPEAEEISTGIDSLDSLSIDIARMIDHDAAIEAWDRFKRGERGVFNRRLYTTAGQKSFEEIRKKYRRNASFRETVDRYIDEFEKLLEQVSRDDRGQALTRTYLTSDTGKVYTLLAHAAGRLG